MAGSLRASIHERRRVNTGTSRWAIGFARFVPYPFTPPPCPILKPIGKRELNPSPYGTWFTASTLLASLQLVNEVNTSDVILSVALNGIVLEEHYISKLNFSWPQMSCVSGFPPRGSRVILVSFSDSANEIQKFALRFSTCDAAETFVVALKGKLKGIEEAGIQRSETRSEISFQTDYNPSDEIVYRAPEVEPYMIKHLPSYVPEEEPSMARPLESYVPEEESYMARPLESYVPEMLPRLEYETGQVLYQLQSEFSQIPKETPINLPEMLPRLEYETGQALYHPQPESSQIPKETPINLPPSFTTLLSGCYPNSTLDAGQTSAKQDPDLKSQILKYMEDSSFQDMLQKVERIMDEIGGNWIH